MTKETIWKHIKRNVKETISDSKMILDCILMYFINLNHFHNVSNFFDELVTEGFGKNAMKKEILDITKPTDSDENRKDCTFCTYHIRERSNGRIDASKVSFYKIPETFSIYKKELSSIVKISSLVSEKRWIYEKEYEDSTMQSSVFRLFSWIMITGLFMMIVLLMVFPDSLVCLLSLVFISFCAFVSQIVSDYEKWIIQIIHEEYLIENYLKSIHYPLDGLYQTFTTDEPFGNFFVCVVDDSLVDKILEKPKIYNIEEYIG